MAAALCEQFANDAQTTLNGAINNSTTTIVVTSAALFPSVPKFHIRIGNELLVVSAVSGTTWTVGRGAEGTTPASHSDGATVSHVLTAGAIAQFRSDNMRLGTYADRQGPGTDGRVYIPSDSINIYHDQGAQWNVFGPIYRLTEVDRSDFTWVNQGSAVGDAFGGSVYMTAPNGSGNNIRILKLSEPTPPYTVTGCFRVVANTGSGECQFGLTWRESSSGKLHINAILVKNSFGTLQTSIRSTKYTNPTTFSADYSGSPSHIGVDLGNIWLRIEDDGTNRICSISGDGVHFQTYHTVSNTDFITADEVGFFLDSYNSGSNLFQHQLWLLSWSATSTSGSTEYSRSISDTLSMTQTAVEQTLFAIGQSQSMSLSQTAVGVRNVPVSSSHSISFSDSATNTVDSINLNSGLVSGYLLNDSLADYTVNTDLDLEQFGSGSMTYGTGVAGNAYKPNALGDGLKCDPGGLGDSNPEHLMSGDRTISMWLRLNQLGVTQCIMLKGSSVYDGDYQIWVGDGWGGAANQIGIHIFNGVAGAAYYGGNPTLSANTWYHLLLTYDDTATEVKFYVNGTNYVTASMNLNTASGALRIGNDAALAYPILNTGVSETYSLSYTATTGTFVLRRTGGSSVTIDMANLIANGATEIDGAMVTLYGGGYGNTTTPSYILITFEPGVIDELVVETNSTDGDVTLTKLTAGVPAGRARVDTVLFWDRILSGSEIDYLAANQSWEPS